MKEFRKQREEQYLSLLPQMEELLKDEDDLIANMANFVAALYAEFKFHWIGFYRVVGDELRLGPFQGPVACTRIAKGKGVCGTAWAKGKPQLVYNVEDFPGHIACSPFSKSELVLPVRSRGSIVAVLDLDSENLSEFSEMDIKYLEKMLLLLIK